MKYVHPDIDHVFDAGDGKYHSIIIENQAFMRELLSDLMWQTNNENGKSIISEGNQPVAIHKAAEVIVDFLRFDMNQRSLIAKITNAISEAAVSEDFFEDTMHVLSEIEWYLGSLINNYPGDITFTKLTVQNLIKMAVLEVVNEGKSIPEQLIDYFELVTEFDRRKLFFTVNMRDYVADAEMEAFVESILMHGYEVIAIESHEHEMLTEEARYIIDQDLCEIEK